MYNIIQLNDKNLSELQSIAQELGIKKASSFKKEELVYKILDEQAIVGATKKVAADKVKEERKDDKKKRSRISVKKEGADKVYTANKDKAEKVDEPAKLTVVTQPKAEVAPAVTEEAQPQKEPAKAKAAKTKTPKKAAEKKVEEPAGEAAPQEAAPVAEKKVVKKPVRISKAAQEEISTSAVPEDKEKAAVELELPLDLDEDDFIPIEDLPSEKVELPTELLGKFESTKAM